SFTISEIEHIDSKGRAMAAAYFIVLEREIDGVNTDMNGKSLARHIESLDETARELGVRPLSEFFSANPDKLAEFLENEDMDIGDATPPVLHQFTAQDG